MPNKYALNVYPQAARDMEIEKMFSDDLFEDF